MTVSFVCKRDFFFFMLLDITTAIPISLATMSETVQKQTNEGKMKKERERESECGRNRKAK